MIIVDNYHKVASEATGDNYHLNLDGILYLGMFGTSFLVTKAKTEIFQRLK